MKYTEELQQLGLSLNEAKIYQTLIIEGESAVGRLAEKSGIHRRSIYDALNRLVEKGIVSEILESHEDRYQAVDPNKLREIIDEKRLLLESILPHLAQSYQAKPHQNETFMYKGVEGWKNYMRDILRLKQDVYLIGAKGAMAHPELEKYFQQFKRQADTGGIKFHVLYDHVISKTPKFRGHLGNNYRILPFKYSNTAAVSIFADRVITFSAVNSLDEKMDSDFSMTVIVNNLTADAFRLWFQFMWDSCPTGKKNKIT